MSSDIKLLTWPKQYKMETKTMLKTNLNFVPNGINSDWFRTISDPLKEQIYKVNFLLFNQTVSDCSQLIYKIKNLARTENTKILAKAWRTVKRSNKDVPKISFRDKRTTTLEETRLGTQTDRDNHKTDRHKCYGSRLIATNCKVVGSTFQRRIWITRYQQSCR